MPHEALNVQQVARYLNLPERDVLRLAARGRLPARRVNGGFEFRKGQIDQWVEQHMPELSRDRLADIERGVSAHHGLDAHSAIVAPLLPPDGIRVPLGGRTRDGVLRALTDAADAAGLAGMYLTGMTCTPPRPDLEKTALGATESVPWDYFQDPLAAAQAVKDAGRSLVVLEQTPDACDWRHHSFEFPCCFVVGHEVRGVQPGILALADQVVEIPMAGIKKSLNVAVSFGVLAFAVRNQWLARNNGGTSHG